MRIIYYYKLYYTIRNYKNYKLIIKLEQLLFPLACLNTNVNCVWTTTNSKHVSATFIKKHFLPWLCDPPKFII